MHSKQYFEEVSRVAQSIDLKATETLANELVAPRARGGRLSLPGGGGSAANCSHAVNDFRKPCEIEVYTPADGLDRGWIRRG